MDSRSFSSSGESSRMPVAAQKQVRKRLTLSCSECVVKKMRCDRGRPRCRSCIRRETACTYTQLADILRAMGPEERRPRRRVEVERSPLNSDTTSPFSADNLLPPQAILRPSMPITPFRVYHEASDHPFLNYWTMTGGISEVLSILPSKHDADASVEHYFATVDPLYAIISESDYRVEHAHFWSMQGEEWLYYDPAQLALHFIIYAIGTQSIDVQCLLDRTRSPKVYLSAGYQCLCLFPYMSRCSIASLRCMLLMVYHFVNRNLLSDAWTFTGIAQRQAYGLGLHRDPRLAEHHLSRNDEVDRYSLWQALLAQDTWLSIYLRLPPGSMHSEIGPSALTPAQELIQSPSPSQSTAPYAAVFENHSWESSTGRDLYFLQSTWELAAFARENVCVPWSFVRPICSNLSHKSRLILQMSDMCQRWKPPFNAYDEHNFAHLGKRVARQQAALWGNYFSVLAMLHMDENEEFGVTCDIFETLEAAQKGLSIFFALLRLHPGRMDILGGFNVRAYTQASMIGTVLSTMIGEYSPIRHDARILLARSYFDRYVDALTLARGSEDFVRFQTDRLTVLQSFVEKMKASPV